MPPPQSPRLQGSGRRRRAGLIIAALLGVPLGVVLLALGVVAALALSGASIDASRWRAAAAQRASAALGRTVVLDGAFELEPRLGREMGLRLGPLTILNPPGFSGPEFLTIGELRVRVDLFEALRGRLRSSSIEAREVDLRLERGVDGVGNWTAAPPSEDRARQPAIDVARLVLYRLDIHYHDARAATLRVLVLDELSGSARPDQPLRLAARGQAGPSLAYALSVEGGPLPLLQNDAEPWPFTLEADTPGARLQARGVLDAGRRTARLQVDAHADDLAPLERWAGAPLPPFGTASVQCVVSVAPDSVQVSDLHGRLGDSGFSGQLALAFGGARPRLTGTLSAATLDLHPLQAPPPAGSPRSGVDAPAPPALALRDLATFDAEVDLKVGRWLGLGVDLRDTTFAWRADRRGVRVPMRATIAGVPLDGTAELDTLAPTPALAVRLDAHDAVLGDLAQALGARGGVEGTVKRVRLRLHGRGETAAALAHDLDGALALEAARLRVDDAAGAGRIDVAIDTLALSARRGERLHGRARGTLLGERATLRLRGGTLPDMLRDRALPLELDLALARIRLQVEGTVAFAESAHDPAVRFDFRAERVGDLARWLGVTPQASLPVALRGRLRRSGPAWTLDDTTLELGRSRLAIDARSAPVAGRPRLAASVRGTLVDAQELSTLRAGSVRGRAAPGSRAPAFFAGIARADADLDFKLQRLRLARTELEDLAFVARLRAGRLLPTSLTGTVAGAPFTADLEMDLRARPPAARLALAAGVIDIGALLRGLGVAEDIDGQAQSVRIDALVRGSRPDEWARQSAIDLQLRGGTLAIRGAAQSTAAEIRVDAARVGAQAGEPVRARVDGAIGQTAVRIDVTTGTLAELANDAGRVPFALTARAAQAELTLDGDVSLPLGSGGTLSLAMRGERLDALSGLARADLPAWGPWSFSSPIQTTPTGYALPALRVAVGRSELGGAATLDLVNQRPALHLQLIAPSIQIDDFPLPEQLTEPPDEARGVRLAARRMAGHTDRLLSAAFLRRFDATIDVKAKEVLSGSDRLADGALRVKLDGGRLSLDPVVVNLPGGTMRLSVSYDLKESQVELAVAADVERFDYGIIARRLDRTDDLRGLFSANLAFIGTAPSLDTIMRNANGRVDFAVWPTELRSGAFNLWSVNLLLQLLPLIDPDPRATVNCIVGRFDLDHGDLSDDKILIDTSAVRIRGAGHASLATEELEFVFRPRAKGLALFRLQTPLRVTGTVGDRRFGFSRVDVVESVLRLIASPVLLPLERLTLGPLPRDGADVCTDPLRATAR